MGKVPLWVCLPSWGSCELPTPALCFDLHLSLFRWAAAKEESWVFVCSQHQCGVVCQLGSWKQHLTLILMLMSKFWSLFFQYQTISCFTNNVCFQLIGFFFFLKSCNEFRMWLVIKQKQKLTLNFPVQIYIFPICPISKMDIVCSFYSLKKSFLEKEIVW